MTACARTQHDRSGGGGSAARDAVIDIHGHIGSYEGYDLSLPTLLRNIDQHEIGLVLVSNIDGADLPGTTLNLNERDANEATAAVVRRYPKRLRGLVWTRPNDGSAAEIASFFSSNYVLQAGRIFVGMKLHPEMNHFPADDPRVDPYLRICRDAQVAAVFHAGAMGSNADPRRIYAAARRFSDVPIILYHMGFLGPHTEAIAVVRESMDRGDAQLYLGTAQANAEDVLAAIKEVGAERVLFGTDATYYGMDHYDHYAALVDTLKRYLSEADYADVMHENARRVFKLD